MSNGQPVPTNLPSSYASVPYTEIRISHHPASSAEPTPVLICTLHRPKNNNAFTDIMTDELEHFFGLASIDDRVKCIVMTGHGKMFCAGQDLQQGFKLQGNGKNETDKTHRDGFFLPRLIGHARTLQLVTTGATIPATAKQLDGLFSDLCDRQEDVMIREMLWRGPSSAEEAHLLESRVMGHMRGSADNDEAVAAFLEKRKAVFTATMQHDSPPVHPWFTPVNTKNPAVANLATTGKPRL